MSEVFLDTTLVVHLADTKQPLHDAAEAILAHSSKALSPMYALRELLVGPLQNLCSVHNGLKSADNLGEALSVLAGLNPIVGRKKHTRIQIFADSLLEVCRENPQIPVDEALETMAENLALQISRFWRRAKRAKGWSIVQPLGCFGSGDFSFGKFGELKPPGDTFNCDAHSKCSAAGYMSEHLGAVSKLCDALHSRFLSDRLANKAETTSRRAALKHLKDRPAKFDKRKCRALGDAYFAVMCPATAKIATSNKEDFQPLCIALGREMVCPVK